jgi:hypothetical protein
MRSYLCPQMRENVVHTVYLSDMTSFPIFIPSQPRGSLNRIEDLLQALHSNVECTVERLSL